jgi:hypothetical protein
VQYSDYFRKKFYLFFLSCDIFFFTSGTKLPKSLQTMILLDSVFCSSNVKPTLFYLLHPSSRKHEGFNR